MQPRITTKCLNNWESIDPPAACEALAEREKNMNSAGGKAGIPTVSFTFSAENGQHNRANMLLLAGANDLGTHDSTHIRLAVVPIRPIPASTCGGHSLTTKSLQAPFLSGFALCESAVSAPSLTGVSGGNAHNNQPTRQSSDSYADRMDQAFGRRDYLFGHASVFNIPYTSQKGRTEYRPRRVKQTGIEKGSRTLGKFCQDSWG